ncbi:MAG: DUF6320 domain-containing protein [Lachnospiraceae bacterium]|jgi:hypothetical protein|nr:DUF6320 domain-containing protein [Lachnospiraceae bacterium]MEE3460965.1 DUF6320 domain-containing protein [Lachnospiraceae bacterium]
MLKCSHCGVVISDNTNECPLCHNIIGRPESDMTDRYPQIYERTSLIFRLKIFITYILILLQTAAVVVNYYTYDHYSFRWSLLSGAGVLYLLITLFVSFMTMSSHINKIFIQVVSALMICFAVDFFMGKQGWSLSLALPIAVMAQNAAILVFMIINYRNWPNYLMIQIFSVVLGAAALGLHIVGIIESPILVWCAFGSSVILYTLNLVITGRRGISELKRKFDL